MTYLGSKSNSSLKTGRDPCEGTRCIITCACHDQTEEVLVLGLFYCRLLALPHMQHLVIFMQKVLTCLL
jgi:hypothetical protein